MEMHPIVRQAYFKPAEAEALLALDGFLPAAFMIDLAERYNVRGLRPSNTPAKSHAALGVSTVQWRPSADHCVGPVEVSDMITDQLLPTLRTFGSMATLLSQQPKHTQPE